MTEALRRSRKAYEGAVRDSVAGLKGLGVGECASSPSEVFRTAPVAAEGPSVGHGYFLDGAEEEVRVTDAATGGQKGTKMAQVGALPPEALYTVAEVAGRGAAKYELHNARRGYAWSLSFDAAMRHLLKFWAGEDFDAESGQPHVAHVAWHMLTLLDFQIRGAGTDNRFRKE